MANTDPWDFLKYYGKGTLDRAYEWLAADEAYHEVELQRWEDDGGLDN